MCSSGSLGLLSAPQGACSSISIAVTGNATPPKSLVALSVAAGKTAPHSMLEFYGYGTATHTLSISPTYGEFEWIAATCTVYVTASAGNAWTAVKNTDWITVGSSTGTGNGSFTVRPSKNNGSSRAGTVCVTSSSATQLFSVIQNSQWLD